METLKLKLNNDHSVGLGDNLCLLSSLANIPPPVELYVNNEHNTFDRLTQYKRIFRIPNSQLVIHPSDENGNFNNVGWPVKFFTEYFRPSYVSTHGRTHPLNVNRNDKKCIAIACSFDIDKEQADRWPWCRARPASYWGRVFAWVKQMGYDVITVDYAQHDLEDKIELLAKHCRAIISYEGGMAHLAHMLNLPCFLVDWRLPSPSTQLGKFHCEFVHKSKSVYILRDDEELMSWDSNTFSTNIFALEQGKTNNRLVNGDCEVKFGGPGVRGIITVTAKSTGQIMLQTDPIFGDNAVAELLSKYYSSV
jgi:hypothetical protein